MRSITRLVIMDFDGTLMDTMTPDIGKPLWENSTGLDWPHKGWWSKEESLDIDVFGCKPIDKVVDAYQKERADESTLMVMMTGRIPRLADQVKEMLFKHDLTFDEYVFNDDSSTINFKLKRLNYYVEFYPELETMEIWEDRPEHTKVFSEWAEIVKKYGIECKVNQV
jgi:hypothetical protein